jgi:hypothetical protein
VECLARHCSARRQQQHVQQDSRCVIYALPTFCLESQFIPAPWQKSMHIMQAILSPLWRHCTDFAMHSAVCAGSKFVTSRASSPSSSLLCCTACTAVSAALSPCANAVAAAVQCSSTSSSPQLERNSCLAGIVADALLQQWHLGCLCVRCRRMPNWVDYCDAVPSAV